MIRNISLSLANAEFFFGVCSLLFDPFLLVFDIFLLLLSVNRPQNCIRKQESTEVGCILPLADTEGFSMSVPGLGSLYNEVQCSMGNGHMGPLFLWTDRHD